MLNFMTEKKIEKAYKFERFYENAHPDLIYLFFTMNKHINLMDKIGIRY